MGFRYNLYWWQKNDHQNALNSKKITPGMTESYDPYANAIAERVNGILKQEFLIEEYQVDIETMRWLVKDAVRINNQKASLVLSCENT